MKNKIIRNLIRNMKNNGDGKRTYESVRSRKARMMALTLCAALALGQAGAVAYAGIRRQGYGTGIRRQKAYRRDGKYGRHAKHRE